MKYHTLLFAGLIFILLLSCEDKSELDIHKISTEIRADIELSIENSDDAILKNNQSAMDCNFEGSCTFCLNDAENMTNCVESILRIQARKGSFLSLKGFGGDFKIEKLELEWGFKHRNQKEYYMQIPIDLTKAEMVINEQNVEISLDEVLSPLIKCLRPGPENSIIIKVSGISSNLDPQTVAQIKIPLLIETGSFSIRFNAL